MKKIKKTAESKYINYENLDKIGEISVYYGFTPHKSPDIKKIDLDHAKSLLEGDFIDNPEENKLHLPLHVEVAIVVVAVNEYEKGVLIIAVARSADVI
jgi:hypothetical protein